MQDKKWEDLQIADDFMFGIIMQNPEICRMVLELILEIQIEKIEYPEEQKSIALLRDKKSVRLDVYVKDGKGTVYDIEMQTTSKRDLALRSRYYQGMIDLNLIGKGVGYQKLNQSYIIFICTFDPFGRGRNRYTFESICQEDRGLKLEDKATRIFMNTKGTADDVPGPVKRFLRFIDSASKPETDDELLIIMYEELQRVRYNEDWRRDYMTYLMELQEREQEAREEMKQEIIRTMRKNGVEPKQIAKLTGIPLEEVERIEEEAALV